MDFSFLIRHRIAPPLENPKYEILENRVAPSYNSKSVVKHKVSKFILHLLYVLCIINNVGL